MKLNQFNTLITAVILTLFLAACGGGSKQTASEESSSHNSTAATAKTNYTVENSSSKVAWKGEVAGVYGHNGVIEIKNGYVSAAGDKIVGGEVVIDMTTIQPLDSASYDEENSAEKLVGHLSTGDFFLVEEYPTSSFKIKSHEGNKLIGDLTIRGNTHEETVDLSSLEINENGVKGQGVLVFDRQQYDVKWEHYMKDYVLADEIEIKLDISAKKDNTVASR